MSVRCVFSALDNNHKLEDFLFFYSPVTFVLIIKRSRNNSTLSKMFLSFAIC